MNHINAKISHTHVNIHVSKQLSFFSFLNPETTTKFTGFLILLGESVMDNFILLPADSDLEKWLLLEVRVYELLSEQLLFGGLLCIGNILFCAR